MTYQTQEYVEILTPGVPFGDTDSAQSGYLVAQSNEASTLLNPGDSVVLSYDSAGSSSAPTNLTVASSWGLTTSWSGPLVVSFPLPSWFASYGEGVPAHLTFTCSIPKNTIDASDVSSPLQGVVNTSPSSWGWTVTLDGLFATTAAPAFAYALKNNHYAIYFTIYGLLAAISTRPTNIVVDCTPSLNTNLSASDTSRVQIPFFFNWAYEAYSSVLSLPSSVSKILCTSCGTLRKNDEGALLRRVQRLSPFLETPGSEVEIETSEDSWTLG